MQPKTGGQEANGKKCSAFQSHSAIRFDVEITAPLAPGNVDYSHWDCKVTEIGRMSLEAMRVPNRPKGVRTQRGNSSQSCRMKEVLLTQIVRSHVSC